MLPDRLYFLGHQNHCRSWLKRYDKPRQHSKKQRHYFADKDPNAQSYGFSSSHVWILVLDHKEGWMPKNWCFELWFWKRLLRIPCSARISSDSILKETNLQYSFSLVQFSHLVLSNSLQPHGLQHTRLPCPPPTPGACSNSCSWSQWCNPTTSSSVIPSLLLLPSIFPSIRVFSNESVLHIKWPR